MKKTVENYFNKTTTTGLAELSLADSTKYYLAASKFFTGEMTVIQLISVYHLRMDFMLDMLGAYQTWANDKIVQDAHDMTTVKSRGE